MQPQVVNRIVVGAGVPPRPPAPLGGYAASPPHGLEAPCPLTPPLGHDSRRHASPSPFRRAASPFPQSGHRQVRDASPMRMYRDVSPSPRPLSAHRRVDDQQAASPQVVQHAVSSSSPSQETLCNVVEGMQVDYWSQSNNSWVPGKIQKVDAETGKIELDLKRGVWMDSSNSTLVRPRSKPTQQHLDNMRRIVENGQVEKVASELISKCSLQDQTANRKSLSVDKTVVPALGAQMDKLLGISGSSFWLSSQIRKADNGLLTFDTFSMMLWERIHAVRKLYEGAIRGETAHCQMENPQNAYELQRKLGEGTFGAVFLAKNRETGARRAIKQVVAHSSVVPLEQLQREIDNLCALDHPHVVKLYQHYRYGNHVYLVMDFCSGGELRGVVDRHINAGHHIKESFTSEVMQQILKAITHVHSRGIIHLDLKLENVMLMPAKATLPPAAQGGAAAETMRHEKLRPHAMVIDLGVAQIFRPGDFDKNRPCGTPATMAPEVWQGVVTPKADVFSLGVMLFELLCNTAPFCCQADHALAIRYWTGRPQAPWNLLAHASQNSIAMCSHMLAYDRQARPSAADCLQAPFITGAEHTKQAGSAFALVAPRLARVHERTFLQHSVAIAIARNWPGNQLPSIKRAFESLDTEGSGRLKTTRLVKEFITFGFSAATATKAVQAMDLDRSSFVEWTEFVASCLNLSSDTLDDDLKRLFVRADRDGDELLGMKDLSSFLAEFLGADTAGKAAAAQALFELTGSKDADAKADWIGFRRHFRPQSGQNYIVVQQSDAVAARASSSDSPAPASAPPAMPALVPVNEERKSSSADGAIGAVPIERRSSDAAKPTDVASKVVSVVKVAADARPPLEPAVPQLLREDSVEYTAAVRNAGASPGRPEAKKISDAPSNETPAVARAAWGGVSAAALPDGAAKIWRGHDEVRKDIVSHFRDIFGF